MKTKKYRSVWDAIESDPETAASMLCQECATPQNADRMDRVSAASD